MPSSEFAIPTRLRNLYIGLCAAILIIAAAGTALTIYRGNFLSVIPLLFWILLIVLGSLAQLHVRYSLGEREITIRKLLSRQAIPFSDISRIEINTAYPTWFEKFFGYRDITLYLKGKDPVTLGPSYWSELCQALQRCCLKLSK